MPARAMSLIASSAIIAPMTPGSAPIDAGLGAGGDELGRRRLGEEALVAGAAAGRVEERDLAFPLAHRGGDERAAGGDAGGVDEVAGGEVVAAVEDEVVGRDEAGGGGGVEAEGVRLDGDVRVEAGERAGGALGLGRADLGGGVQHLALQVGEADRVVVDDAEGADAGGGEVEERRAAEAAGADDEHAGGLQALLAGAADLVQHDVAGVAGELVRVEGHGLSRCRWSRSRPSPRALSASASASAQAMRATGASTSWAMRVAVGDGDRLGARG